VRRRQTTSGLNPRRNGSAPPHQATLPHARSSFPRPPSPWKMLGPPFPTLPDNRDALSGRVATKGHGEKTTPCSFQITDTTHRPSIKWPSHSPTSQPLTLLDIEMALGNVPYGCLNIGGREHTFSIELWPFLTRSPEVVSTLQERSHITTHHNTVRAKCISPHSSFARPRSLTPILRSRSWWQDNQTLPHHESQQDPPDGMLSLSKSLRSFYRRITARCR
jgi:hypothetical protein